MRADVDALIAGIQDGTIDCLATDHAPHTPEDKANGAAGISGIEHAFQIYLKVFTDHGIPLTRLSQMLSLNPARRLGLKAGLFLPGYPADVTALAVEEESELDAYAMISRSHNTPFHGRAVRGRVLKTIVDGETRYEYERWSEIDSSETKSLNRKRFRWFRKHEGDIHR
jgi:dihydroorotase